LASWRLGDFALIFYHRPGQKMPKIKVIRVIARLNIGGPAIHTILLTKHLNPQRFETMLVTGLEEAHEGSRREWAISQGVTPITIPELGRELNLISDLKVLFKLYRLFRREKPHIVHTHTAKAGFVGRLAARLAGTPVVAHTFHGHVFHSYFGPFKTRLFIFIERLLARITDRIITISPRQRQEILDFGIASPHKIIIIPLGFNLEPFLNNTHLTGQLRTQLNLPPDIKLVGIVARLTAIKNHHLFLQAAALVHQQCNDVHFLIVGDGELRAELEHQAEDLQLAGVVHFLGWRQDLPKIYAGLDLVVLSSNNEGTPVTLIEAQASGCPVVATAVGGAPDIVADGHSGFLVPPNNAPALAEAIIKALSSNLQPMGQAGRQFVKDKFTFSRLVNDIETLYGDLLARSDLKGF
jgi:glycosyltransferase involved in cell wall biosynthesis